LDDRLAVFRFNLRLITQLRIDVLTDERMILAINRMQMAFDTTMINDPKPFCFCHDPNYVIQKHLVKSDQSLLQMLA